MHRRRVRFVVEYHGAAFAGFARNDGVVTVAGALEAAMSTVCGEPVRITGAGRTDRGVHATGQVISVDLPGEPGLSELVRRINSMCAPSVSLRDARETDASFDARFSATTRSYRYTLWNRVEPSPMMADRSWHVPEALSLEAMQQAAGAFVGEHDFTSLCRRPPGASPDEPIRRRVLSAEWSRDHRSGPRHDPGAVVVFDIVGSAFCHQMVRSIVGLCVEIGRGRRRAADVLTVLRARDRAASAPIAPPHGLCLIEVGYR